MLLVALFAVGSPIGHPIAFTELVVVFVAFTVLVGAYSGRQRIAPHSASGAGIALAVLVGNLFAPSQC